MKYVLNYLTITILFLYSLTNNNNTCNLFQRGSGPDITGIVTGEQRLPQYGYQSGASSQPTSPIAPQSPQFQTPHSSPQSPQSPSYSHSVPQSPLTPPSPQLPVSSQVCVIVTTHSEHCL